MSLQVHTSTVCVICVITKEFSIRLIKCVNNSETIKENIKGVYRCYKLNYKNWLYTLIKPFVWKTDYTP
jgi:hypothetical protein